MDNKKLESFIMAKQDCFPAEKIMYLKEKLSSLDDDKLSLIYTIELKDPMTLLIISIFLGTLGIDRFMLGDTAMGVLKLLTGGCCGILTIIDWINITKMTKEHNFNKIMSLI